MTPCILEYFSLNLPPWFAYTAHKIQDKSGLFHISDHDLGHNIYNQMDTRLIKQTPSNLIANPLIFFLHFK